MKRKITLVCALLASAFTNAPTAQLNQWPQAGPTCGMDAAMAKMPLEVKAEMSGAAFAAQSGELLLYINFNVNGSTVRPGFGNADTLTTPIVSSVSFCPPPLLSEEQKAEIVKLVSDDFSPFNIRVTTDAAEFLAYPRLNKQMCLITTTPSVVGFPSSDLGVSPFAGIGFRLPGDFAFAFSSAVNGDPKFVAAVVSHETGHLLGLGHQHLYSDTCSFLSEYHPGFGSGPLSFDPLMGDAIGDGINNWFAQSCLDPTFQLPQNDYDLINSQVVVRPDDFPDERLGRVVDANSIRGALERAGDVDFIRINFKSPGPVVITSDNIDLKVSLLNLGGRVIYEINDPAGTNVTIPSASDMRYLKVEAASNDNMSAQFMTGKYQVSF